VAMGYIAFVFAVDFIIGQLQKHGAGGYPVSYVPFAVMLAGGFGLRVVATDGSQVAARLTSVR
jgi:hypothetical protein